MKPTLNTINKVIEVTGKSYLEVLPIIESSESIVKAITTILGTKDFSNTQDYLYSEFYNKYIKEIHSVKRGRIVTVITNHICGFPATFITKVLAVQTYTKPVYVDVFDPFKNIYKSVCFNGMAKVILQDYLPSSNSFPYYMYLNNPIRFEYLTSIRFATEEEKKEYRKIINRLKRYGD